MKDEYDAEVEHIVKCTECLSRNLITDFTKGELYCGDCGLVLDDEMLEETSHGKEKAGDFESARTHEISRPSYTMGSVVGTRNIDGSLDRSKLGRKLRNWDKRTKISSNQKNQLKGIVAIKMLAANLRTTDGVKEQAASIYKRVYKESWMRGSSLDVRAAAILFWVFKENGINIKMHEIVEHNGAHPRQTTKMVRRLATHFRKPWLLSERNFEGDISKWCSQLEMQPEAIAETIKLSIPIEQMGEAKCLSMNSGFIAAIIYIAILCRDYSYRTQRELSDVIGVTEVTLRTNFKTICREMGLDKELVKEGQYSVEDIVTGAYRNE